MFHEATKEKAKLRLLLAGTANSGKTFTALRIATRLAALAGEGKRFAVIDTEHGTSEKYAKDPNPDGGVFAFKACRLESFSVDDYLTPLRAAVEAGYPVVVVDGLTHAWTHKGGILPLVDSTKGKSKFTGGWKVATPEHQRLIEGLLACDAHIICTVRTKSEYVIEKGANGKDAPRKVGMAPIQRDGLSYEFDVVLDLDADHHATVSKTRCSVIDGEVFERPGADLADTLNDWLTDGVEPRKPGVYRWPDEDRKWFEAGLKALDVTLKDTSDWLVKAKNWKAPSTFSREALEKILGRLQAKDSTGLHELKAWIGPVAEEVVLDEAAPTEKPASIEELYKAIEALEKEAAAYGDLVEECAEVCDITGVELRTITDVVALEEYRIELVDRLESVVSA